MRLCARHAFKCLQLIDMAERVRVCNGILAGWLVYTVWV